MHHGAVTRYCCHVIYSVVSKEKAELKILVLRIEEGRIFITQGHELSFKASSPLLFKPTEVDSEQDGEIIRS